MLFNYILNYFFSYIIKKIFTCAWHKSLYSSFLLIKITNLHTTIFSFKEVFIIDLKF